MSFDMTVCRYRDKAFAAFGRGTFEAWFKGRIIHRDPHLASLGYADGSGDVYVGGDWDGFTVNGPGGLGLFQDHIAFADAVGAAIFWPDAPNAVGVMRPKTIPFCPTTSSRRRDPYWSSRTAGPSSTPSGPDPGNGWRPVNRASDSSAKRVCPPPRRA